MKWYVSSPRATCKVETDKRGVIVDAAPVWRRFIGQRMTNLLRWLGKEGLIVKPLKGVL